MKFLTFIKYFLSILLIINIIFFITSYFLKNNIPQQNEISNDLNQNPKQQEINLPSFQIDKNSVKYTITPKYNYELWGLIVSQNDNESWLGHITDKDPLNVKDICVVWGKNIQTGIYQKLKYKTPGVFCQVESKTKEDYSSFSNEHLSNNHLLVEDQNAYREIKKSKIGDQIFLKGYLVSYEATTPKGEKIARGTSNIRTDTGEGACETIYITDFKILKIGNPVIDAIFRYSKYSIPIILSILVIFFIISIFPKKSDYIKERNTNIIKEIPKDLLPQIPKREKDSQIDKT